GRINATPTGASVGAAFMPPLSRSAPNPRRIKMKIMVFLSDYRVSEAVTISCNSNLNEYISHLLS
ncbi:hypothetical protein, partial [Pantoea eucrina]|uniref:hypothetical protein n=1 Tax=Pantoea eucrina TaxID=472693 RepID=UPI0028971B39